MRNSSCLSLHQDLLIKKNPRKTLAALLGQVGNPKQNEVGMVWIEPCHPEKTNHFCSCPECLPLLVKTPVVEKHIANVGDFLQFAHVSLEIHGFSPLHTLRMTQCTQVTSQNLVKFVVYHCWVLSSHGWWMRPNRPKLQARTAAAEIGRLLWWVKPFCCRVSSGFVEQFSIWSCSWFPCDMSDSNDMGILASTFRCDNKFITYSNQELQPQASTQWFDFSIEVPWERPISARCFLGLERNQKNFAAPLLVVAIGARLSFQLKLLCFNENNSHASKLYMEGAQFGIGMVFPRGIGMNCFQGFC